MSERLAEIVARRRSRLASEGPELGEPVPATRQLPVAPFVTPSPLICEVKRRSPSRGDIDADLDPVELAATYGRHGATAISVLTERDHFAGSLADLMAVKRALPTVPVLRKDFLLRPADVDVAFRAGADAVLLLASVLPAADLAALLERANELGLAALVEVHSSEEIAAVRALRPPLIGVNCRNLRTFEVDLTLPAQLAPQIDWPATLLFESGVRSAEDAALARSSGYDGVLVGESVVREPSLVGDIAAQLRVSVSPFWKRMLGRGPDGATVTPLVKICGLTTQQDAEHAAACGADALGFILADSKRRASAATVRSVPDLGVPKVGVVVDEVGEAAELLAEGALDALQLHGDEPPGSCFSLGFPYYKVLRVADGTNQELASAASGYRCPRVLIDHDGGDYRGGSGQRVSDAALAAMTAARGNEPLWLAGGLAADNVADAVARWQPELVDAASRLESAPGRKNPSAVRAFVDAAKRAGAQLEEQAASAPSVAVSHG